MKLLTKIYLAFILLCGCGIIGLVCFEFFAKAYLKNTWGFIQPHEKLGWAFKPGVKSDAIIAQKKWILKKNTVQINSRGLRDDEIPYTKPLGVKRILCLGDSYVEAFQVPFSNIFSKVMEKKLNQGLDGTTKFEVINAGFGNYGTDQELLYYKNEGYKYHPDLVILYFFPFNDFSDNSIDLNDRAYLPKPFFDIKNDTLIWPDQLRISPLMSQMKETNVFIQKASTLNSYHLINYFLKSFHWDVAQQLSRLGILPKSLVDNSDGYPLLYDICKKSHGKKWEKSIRLTTRLIEAMQKEATINGARFKVVILPFLEIRQLLFPQAFKKRWAKILKPGFAIGQPEKLAEKLLDELAIDYLNLTSGFRKAFTTTNKPTHLLFDGHLTAFGHEIVAEETIRFIDTNQNL